MVDAFTKLQMDIIFSIHNYCEKKKGIQNILLLQTNDKYKVIKRKPVVSEHSPNLFPYTKTFICID